MVYVTHVTFTTGRTSSTVRVLVTTTVLIGTSIGPCIRQLHAVLILTYASEESTKRTSDGFLPSIGETETTTSIRSFSPALSSF